MISRILNDVREGHYFWMRKKNDESTARIGNFGIIFLTLFIYYTSLLILLAGVVYKFTGSLYKDQGVLTNFPIFFGGYIAFYFLLIYPKIKKEKIDEDISEIEKQRKNKVATRYFIWCVLSVLLSIAADIFIFGFTVGGK